MIKLHTSMGVISIELDSERAPKTVANFLQYVQEGFYDGTLFHRVIPNFMIQGGGFDQHFHQKSTHDPIPNEADNGLQNLKGTLAMARTSDPDSATAQFFINHKDNDFLNYSAPNSQGWGYCVFGKVTEGLDVLDAIAQVKTGSRAGHQDVPIADVLITKAEIVSD